MKECRDQNLCTDTPVMSRTTNATVTTITIRAPDQARYPLSIPVSQQPSCQRTRRTAPTSPTDFWDARRSGGGVLVADEPCPIVASFVRNAFDGRAMTFAGTGSHSRRTSEQEKRDAQRS